jgi:CheY-like chemotaxis protein
MTDVRRALDGSYILLLEDDPESSLACRALLEANGHAVVPVRGGLEALCRLRMDPRAASLMILDLEMPGIGGLDFYRQKASQPRFAQVPVLILSGSSSMATFRFRDDVKARLAKPVDVPTLLLEVSRWTGVPSDPR